MFAALAGLMLANAYGHEAGIAEYVMGAMLALTRNFLPLDAELRRGLWPAPNQAADANGSQILFST